MHVIIDGFGASAGLLQDEPFILGLLDSYPSVIGMTKIMSPHVFRYNGSDPHDWGISGFVLIAESHISIHTFPERRYFNVDIFTGNTNPFNVEDIKQYWKDRFNATNVTSRTPEGGQEYPDAILAASEVVCEERLKVAAAI